MLSYVASARPSKSPDPNAVASPERIARTRTRVSGVSQSQRRFYDLKNMNKKKSNKEKEDTRDTGISDVRFFSQQLAVDRVPRRLD
jgi:hypothetical protein